MTNPSANVPAAAAAAAAKPATKPHDIASLLTDTDVALPPDLLGELQYELQNRVTGSATPDRLRQAADVYRRVASWLQGMDAMLTEQGAEVLREADALDERLAEARGYLAHVREGVSIEQIEWLQHRIPAQQQEVLRIWWPADGIQSELITRDQLVFETQGPKGKRLVARLAPAERERFGVQLVVELYRLVLHDLCGDEVVVRNGKEHAAGKSGLGRALIRHFRHQSNNPFFIHAEAVSEIRRALALPEGWPEWPDVPVAQAADNLTPDALDSTTLDGDGNAVVTVAGCDAHIGSIARGFISGSGMGSRLEAISTDYKAPSVADSIAKSFRANVQYLGVIGAVATMGDFQQKHITILFGLFCLLLAFVGRRQDLIEAKDATARILDQKLRQYASKETASVTDKIIRAIRAFHVTAQGKIVQETETQIRAIKRPHDQLRRTTPPRIAQAKARTMAHKAHCESMAASIETALRSKSG